MKKSKKGLSPIIATVLLIVIAIALFLIIFLWIRSFQGEKIAKFGSPIENSCPSVYLQLTVLGSDLQIENDGSVPVYKLQIFLLEDGSTTKLGEDRIIDLRLGATWIEPLGTTCSDQLKVIPVLLGTNEKGMEKEYICKDKPIVVSCSSY